MGNILDNTVSKLRLIDGATLGVLPAGRYPISTAFDGSNLWVTNQGGANTVTKLRASDGALLGTFPVGVNPVGAAFDGSSVWVANQGSNTVSRLRAKDGHLYWNIQGGSAAAFRRL